MIDKENHIDEDYLTLTLECVPTATTMDDIEGYYLYDIILIASYC